MRRVLRRLAWSAAAPPGIALLLPLLLGLTLNTDPGRRLAVAVIDQAAGGRVVLTGLHGRFPDRLRLDRIELRDAAGPYAVIEGAALDWSPWRLLRRDVAIGRLAAARVAVTRLPASKTGGSGAGGAPTSLPEGIDLDRLHIGRLELDSAVFGAAAVLTVDGAAWLADLRHGRAEIALRRLDAPGSYRLVGRLDEDELAAAVTAQEPTAGLLATVARLPDLGALDIRASLEGPWRRAAVRVAVAAGPLRLGGTGTVDVTGAAADLDLTATAPAMAPRPDLAWRSVTLDAQIHGPLAGPKMHGTLRIAGFAANGAAVADLAAELGGNPETITITANAAGVRLPGPTPDLLAAAPLRLRATVTLNAPDRPVRFALSHRLLTLTGSAETAGAARVEAHLDVPDLAPFAAAAGAEMQGHAALDVTGAKARDGTIDVAANGSLGITGGPAPLPALLGPAARIDLAASLHDATLVVSHLSLDGQTAQLAARGRLSAAAISLDWQAELRNLSAVAGQLRGAIAGHGHIAGPPDDLAMQAALAGEVAAADVTRGPLTATLDARGLPSRPTGRITAQGTLDGAALDLDATARRERDGTLRLTVARADWKSLHAEADLVLPAAAAIPLGTLTLRMVRLDDFSRLLGRNLAGSLAATVNTAAQEGKPTAKVVLDVRNAALAGLANVGRAALEATVRDPAADADVAATFGVTGLRVGGISGDARLTVAGRPSALALRAEARLPDVAGAELRASGAATADIQARHLTLSAMQVDWRDETLRLLAPARIDLAGGIGVDRLRLGLRQAVLELAGRLAPALDLTVALRDLPAALGRALTPDYAADGVLDAEARLNGTTTRPRGSLRLAARGIHLRSGAAAGLPPADLTAEARLAGTTADLAARLSVGRNAIILNGTAPLDPAGAMRLRAEGALDLATLNPLLSAAGRHVLGEARLDVTVTGTPAAPRASGALRLVGGDVQDFSLGAHVSDITALIEAQGDTIRLLRCTARAGAGRIDAHGSVGLGDGMPIDLALTAQRAKPLASDRLTATLDANLTLRGELDGALAAGGTVRIDQAEIRIPDKLPSSLPVLAVRRVDQPAPPPPAPPPNVGLDVTVAAPGQVFVRGRGMFAEVAGQIHIGGTAAAPLPAGSFRLRRGAFNLAGTTLQFTGGSVRFEGSGRLDPALNLVATSTNGTITATLTVSGFANAPKVTLSSVPDLPQDEVLAQLLFRQSASTLSPVQLAAIAAGLAQIAGVGGGAFDPLNTVRQELGLDRLTFGGGQAGTGTAVEAGRYVTPRIYVGAKQATNGNGTQATVQIDLMRGLKLNADVGTGGSASVTGAAAAENPYGTSIGLTYQFRY